MSKCLLHCLEQTESKYVEALGHSDGSTKHRNEENIQSFLFLSKSSVFILFSDVLLQNATVGSWVYFQPNFVKLWRVWLSQYWICLPYPKSRMSEFVFPPIVTWFYCYKTPFTDSLHQNATLGSWGLFSTQFCESVTCLVVTVLDLPHPHPRCKNVRIRIFTPA